MAAGPLLALAISAALAGQSIDEFRAACDRGDNNACLTLGHYLLQDRRHEAFSLFATSCDRGSASACDSASTLLAGGAAPNLPAAFDFSRRACAMDPHAYCADVVSIYRRMTPADRVRARDTTAGAVAGLEGACRPDAATFCARIGGKEEAVHCQIRTAGACRDVANFAGTGVPGIVPADRARALHFLRLSCDANGKYVSAYSRSCDQLRWATAPPPTPADIDDLRAWLARRTAGISTSTNPHDHRVLCVALATDGSGEGVDPPPALMDKLADLERVHPVSWCRQRKLGSILAFGPVVGSTGWPPGEGFSTWYISYSWEGFVGAGGGLYAKEGSRWKAGQGAAAIPLPTAPVAPDPARDPALLKALSAFVNAWNRGDATLPGAQERAKDLPAREHTRLVIDPATITLASDRASATVNGEIVGRFQTTTGVPWLGEPWKPEGARTAITVLVRRTGGWWRQGEWDSVSYVAPWNAIRIQDVVDAR